MIPVLILHRMESDHANILCAYAFVISAYLTCSWQFIISENVVWLERTSWMCVYEMDRRKSSDNTQDLCPPAHLVCATGFSVQ